MVFQIHLKMHVDKVSHTGTILIFIFFHPSFKNRILAFVICLVHDLTDDSGHIPGGGGGGLVGSFDICDPPDFNVYESL